MQHHLGTFLAAVTCALILAGCVTAEDQEKTNASREAAGMRPERVRMTEGEVRSAFVNRTRVTSAGTLGSQVSYMAPDGATYLWFPGNRTIVQGRWSIEQTGGYRPYAGRPVTEYSVCFMYGPGSVNAFTGRRSENSCAPADMRVPMIQDSAEGDVFSLARRNEAPFVLPPGPATIAALRARLSGSTFSR